MTRTLTIDLSDTAIQRFMQVANVTDQPIEQLVRQSIEGNLPPPILVDSPELAQELLAMQTLPQSKLRKIAESQIPAKQQTRHLDLLEKNSSDILSAAEQDELVQLRQFVDKSTYIKAYAWALLRWRGVPLPKLEELPLE